MRILTYGRLDHDRKNALDAKAGKIAQKINEQEQKTDQTPEEIEEQIRQIGEEIIKGVPLYLAFYGLFFNPKALGGYFKRYEPELAPHQVIAEQVRDDQNSDPNFNKKVKIVLNTPFASAKLSSFLGKPVNELADPTTGEIKNVDEFAELVATNPPEDKQKTLLAMIQSPEFEAEKNVLTPEFEALKSSSSSEEHKQTEAKLGGEAEEAAV